jgi:hypothetical protein
VYWNNEPAQNAIRQYLERIGGGQFADQPMAEEVREHLPVVDVEAVYTLYCDNLKTFFDNAQRESKAVSGVEFDGMLKYDRDNPPKDGEKGWVVEIRGSTWNKDSRKFVIESLVHNLTHMRRKSLPVAGAAPPPPAEGSDSAAKPESDPTVDRVSHVFLFNYRIDHNPTPGSFLDVGKTSLPGLVSTGSSAAPAIPGGDANQTVSSRDSWRPLLGGGSGAGSTPGFAGGGGRGGRAGGIGRGGGGESSTGSSSPAAGTAPGASGAPTTSAVDKKGKPRYEFIVMFIWREPTPSDALLAPAVPPQ